MMKIIADYHMHTSLCGHAVGIPEDYVLYAISQGLKEIGFSDHAPFVTHEDSSITMGMDQLPEYHRMIHDVQKRFPQISIKLGIEADFFPGYEEATKKILENYQYDYVIGSVHFIEKWGFDNPQERKFWEGKDVNEVYRKYFELLRKAAETGLYDIMGHVDLIKKFGHRSSDDLTQEINQNAEVFKSTGVAIEINSSGLRKPVKEIYPSLDHLKIYCEKGIPLVFGSDSHAPQEVGSGFDQAFDLAKSAGYKEYVLFKNRKIERIVEL